MLEEDPLYIYFKKFEIWPPVHLFQEILKLKKCVQDGGLAAATRFGVIQKLRRQEGWVGGQSIVYASK